MCQTLPNGLHLRSLWNCELLHFTLHTPTKLDDYFYARLMAADYYEGNVPSDTTNANNRGANASLSVIIMNERLIL